MEKIAIRDFYNRIIGYIETDSKGNKTVRDWRNVIQGYYYKSDDTTRDFYRRIIAKGDQTGMLIKNN